MTKTADAVIIGGGISGVSIAYNLAKKGVRHIVVLEKGYLAGGSTGRCGAGIRMQWGTELNCAFAKYSIEFFERAGQELGYSGDIGFKQDGYLIVGTTEKERAQFDKNLALQQGLGISSRAVSPREAREIIPHLDESKITCATFCPKDGHLDPFHMTQAYAEAAQRLGVRIERFTEVRGIETDGGRVRAVLTDRARIQTPVVINAAGGYATDVAAMAGVTLPIYPERHEILVTEPVAPLQGPMLMSFSLNIYCQQTPEGSFIMGRSPSNEPPGHNVRSSWAFMEQMARTCCALLPPLKKLSVVRQWAGLYAMTPDRQPIYGGVPGLEGFYLACGFSGHGFMFAPATGVVLAETVLGQPLSLPAQRLDLGRFARGEEVWEPSVV